MKEEALQTFRAKLESTLKTMANLDLNTNEFEASSNTFDASRQPGIASIVGFSGKLKGRSLIWIPENLARTITKEVIGETPENYREEIVLFTINELNNVLSGLSISEINNQFDLGLRLSPPSVFAGESFSLTTPRLNSNILKGLVEQETLYFDLALEGGWSE